MAHQLHSINPRALEADAYELRFRIGDAWNRLIADKPLDDYEKEKTLEDVDRALALAFKLTDILSEVTSELRRGRDRHPAPKTQPALN